MQEQRVAKLGSKTYVSLRGGRNPTKQSPSNPIYGDCAAMLVRNITLPLDLDTPQVQRPITNNFLVLEISAQFSAPSLSVYPKFLNESEL